MCGRPPTTGAWSPAASCIGSSATPEAGELKVPTRADVQVFPSAASFRSWLEANHETEDELFVGYYRKGVPKTSMTYTESVEEALCFGWIDGITRRIDDEVTCTRFTPRRKNSNWSAINIARVAALTDAGRMHPAGIRAFEARDRGKDSSYAAPAQLPREMLDRLRADDAAWEYWQSRAPSFRRHAAYWVTSAKREETRERRFATLLADSAAGRRPKPFIVAREDR
jgi:uncharacterized protein YdeI (YjbR/CyaY-like superfamily)